MHRLLRTIALLVLLVSTFQIAMCATDCDCFLPSASRMSSHSTRGDADGCLCCAQYARIAGPVEVPGPLLEQFVSSVFAVQIPQNEILHIYRPPRS